MALKRTDYTIEKGTLKVQFRRGVKINDKTTNLTVELSLNFKKGLHTINQKLDHDQITHNKIDDQATIKVLQELTFEAIEYAREWRNEWLENRGEADPEQLEIDLGSIAN